MAIRKKFRVQLHKNNAFTQIKKKAHIYSELEDYKKHPLAKIMGNYNKDLISAH